MRRAETRRDELSLADLVLAALFLGIGFILHAVFPPFLAGMKPDFSLMMLFVIIMLIPDRRIVMLAGIATGIITALTTTFPAGQIPNVVDKLVTTSTLLLVSPILPNKVKVPVLGVVGTFISGVVFLGTAALLTGLPAPFVSLVTTVVVPAAVVNTVALLILYPVAAKLYGVQVRRSQKTQPVID